MELKIFDVRAPGTQTAAFAIKLGASGTEERILQREGFSERHILVGTLKPSPNYVTYKRHDWLRGDGDVRQLPFMYLVHDEIAARWEALTSGDTVDVTPRASELDRLLTQAVEE